MKIAEKDCILQRLSTLQFAFCAGAYLAEFRFGLNPILCEKRGAIPMALCTDCADYDSFVAGRYGTGNCGQAVVLIFQYEPGVAVEYGSISGKARIRWAQLCKRNKAYAKALLTSGIGIFFSVQCSCFGVKQPQTRSQSEIRRNRHSNAQGAGFKLEFPGNAVQTRLGAGRPT